jgi:hypothetical protein
MVTQTECEHASFAAMPLDPAINELREAASAAKSSEEKHNSHRDFVRRQVSEQLHD